MLLDQSRPFTAERPAVVRACRRVRCHAVGGPMTAVTVPTQPALKRTPLYDLHVAMGARTGALRRLRNAHPVSGAAC